MGLLSFKYLILLRCPSPAACCGMLLAEKPSGSSTSLRRVQLRAATCMMRKVRLYHIHPAVHAGYTTHLKVV